MSLWSVELGLESPCLSFPSLSLVFLFAFLPCGAHGLSVRTSECLLDHFLVPVKAYQNLVSSSLCLLLSEIPEPSGSLMKGFLSLNILTKHSA